MFLKTEARQFKEKAKMFMPPRTIKEEALLGLDVEVRTRWKTEKGTARKLDIQNLEKILIDAISEKYYFDDSRVWQKRCLKVEAASDEVFVRLSVFGP